MKNNKGFSLMELLTVIIILAAISIAVTPIVTTIIHTTQQKAVLNSAQAYIRAVNDQIVSNQTKYLTLKSMNGDASAILQAADSLIKDTDIGSDGTVKPYSINDLSIRNVSVDGNVPTDGGIVVANGTVFDYELVINGYLVEYNETDGTLKATLNGSYDKNKLTYPAVVTLKMNGGYVKDGTEVTDANYALGDINYRYTDASKVKYFSIKEGNTNVLYQTIGVMDTTDANGSKESRIKLIRVTGVTASPASFDALNTTLNSTFRDTLTDLKQYDIKTQYYSGTSSVTGTQNWDIPTRTYKNTVVTLSDIYKAERYNKTLLKDSFYYSSEVDPYTAEVGLMYESDCFAASWLKSYGLTVTKKYNTNNYFYCNGSLSDIEVKSTNSITYHPVIYLPKNAVISSTGSGTSTSPYTLIYIK